MNEQVHAIATNYLYMVPIAMAVTALWLKLQKSRVKNPAKNVILDNGFFLRNVLFVGTLVFLIMYLGKPLPGFEESIIVRPADF